MADVSLDGRSVGVTVCPNGIGHAVRALRVLRVLVEEHGPVGPLFVTLTRDQWSALSQEGRAWLAQHDVTVLHDVVEPGVGLAGADSGFADGRLTAWSQRWASSSAAQADLVVSDNLVGVLEARPDAVLMGSFLWSDVLEAVAAGPMVDEFVARERALLAAHRPPMLATADVVHPGVVRRTAAVLLPWFDDRRAPAGVRAPGAAKVVAVVGGRTGAADDLLGRVAAALTRSGREVLRDLTGPHRDRIDVLVCRPGLGTVTAGVLDSIPMLLVSEPGNPELDHTSASLVALGLARLLKDTDDPRAVVAAVSAMEDEGVQRRMRDALSARPSGGHREAAAFLAARTTRADDGTEEGRSAW